MNLPPRALALKPLVLKDKPVLALDTGFAADSLEGLRLVKASRGQGWFFLGGSLSPWTTKGVTQEDGRLVVWGDLTEVPPGATPDQWPRKGDEARAFLKALVLAWTSVDAAGGDLGPFSSSAVVPLFTDSGWAFAFLPPELRSVLDSLQPLDDRLAWDHFRHPDAVGPASWAFASAALAWDLVAGELPWAQDEEAHLRQEIRDLRKTLQEAELPPGPDPETLQLWFQSLTGRLVTPAARWRVWAEGNPVWTLGAPDPSLAPKQAAARLRRSRRRSGAAFWRRRGTVTTAIAVGVVLVLAVVGSVIWGLLKPDPTDRWTPEQVVLGYYAAVSDLDADLMRKITRFDKGAQPTLGQDQDEASNLFVIRQIRTAYEHQSPVIAAQDWETAGRPALAPGQVLFGVAGLEVVGEGQKWTARYRKWVSESEEGVAPRPVGAQMVDDLGLVQTGKGWKISVLRRQRQPLP